MRLIDADALKKQSEEIAAIEWNQKEAPISWAYAEENFAQRIDDAPTIDAVPVVHGRWEKSQYNGYLVCSACRDVYVDNDWVDGKKWHYCPNCGARMDTEADE